MLPVALMVRVFAFDDHAVSVISSKTCQQRTAGNKNKRIVQETVICKASKNKDGGTSVKLIVNIVWFQFAAEVALQSSKFLENKTNFVPHFVLGHILNQIFAQLTFCGGPPAAERWRKVANQEGHRRKIAAAHLRE